MQWPLLIILILSFVINSYYLIWVLKGLKKASGTSPEETQQLYDYSIIIAAHNEENTIGQCLEKLLLQKYPHSQFEILVAADRCTDRTIKIVNQLMKKVQNLRLIEINQVPEGISPKKYAIEKAISGSKYHHFLFLDADVLASDRFIKVMNAYFSAGASIVVGLMQLKLLGTIWHKFLLYERLLNWSVSAAGIGNEQPIIAYGGSWGYTREAFEKVEGFKGIKHSLGGDDDLLLQKFGKANLKVCFCFDSDGWVFTEPPKGFSQFLRQRKRHIAAGKYYQPKFKIGYLLFHITNIILWIGWVFLPPLVLLLFLRILLNGLLIRRANKLFQKKLSILLLPLYELLFLLYNVSTGMLTRFKKRIW
jgi:cellulose synthase/poly-beta-1,6-N-acetylglucosamine synthase-like glycosyltransferase